MWVFFILGERSENNFYRNWIGWLEKSWMLVFCVLIYMIGLVVFVGSILYLNIMLGLLILNKLMCMSLFRVVGFNLMFENGEYE